MCDSVTSPIGDLENIGSLSHEILQMFTYFIIQYQKSHLLIISPVSLEKSLNIGKLPSSWLWIQVFK